MEKERLGLEDDFQTKLIELIFDNQGKITGEYIVSQLEMCKYIILKKAAEQFDVNIPLHSKS